VLLVASFNSIGSLTMLIIEKKKDIAAFHALGAQRKWIKRIFTTEGMMISLLGCMVGMTAGLITCWVQIKFQLLKIEGNFLIDAYPVSIQWSDIALIFLAVMLIGYIASRFPTATMLKMRNPKPKS
jgi:lipoprotein-releasing system permease protein